MTPFIGIVEDNLDPKNEARLKIRIYGVTDQKDDDDEESYVIPTEFLPWARPLCLSGGSYTIPKIGQEVYVTGDVRYAPLWLGVVNIGSEMSKEVGDEDSSASHILMYDTDFSNGEEDGGVRAGEFIKMYFTDTKGLVIDYKNYNGNMKFEMGADGSITLSNINGDSITMNNGEVTIKSDNIVRLVAPRIELGGDVKYSGINGDLLMEAYNRHTHLTKYGESEPPLEQLPPETLNYGVNL